MSASAAPLKQTSVLRTAAGEPPLGRDGGYFLDDQGEIFEHDNPRYRAPSTKISVLALEGGKWLAQPPSFHVCSTLYDSRDEALRAGIARMIRRARKYMRNQDGEGTCWNHGFGGRVIEWALSLKPPKNMGQGTAADAAAASGHPGSLQVCANSQTEPNACPNAGVTDDTGGTPSGALTQSLPADPAIRSLYEANRARKVYPSDHTVTMTNPVVNGRMVTLGTCACGKVFSYPWTKEGRMFLMPAAIEAHWQKFDHLPENVDGRGQPIEINGEERAAPSSPARKRNRRDGKAGGHPKAGDSRELANAPLPEPESVTPGVAGSGSPAGDEYLAGIINREPGAGGHPAPLAADASSKLLPAAEPAPVNAPRSPDGAGSSLSVSDAPIGAGETAAMGGEPSSAPGPVAAEHHPHANTPAPDDVARQMAADPADDWSPLLKAALDLAWREEPQQPDPFREFEQSLPPLMGPEERRREITEFKLALKQKPVNLGPLFGSVPPLDDIAEAVES